MSQLISSSLMSRYVSNAEDSQCFQPSKMKKCEERRLQEDAVEKQAQQGFSL